MFQDLPPRARWFVTFVIALGAVVLVVFLPRAEFSPVLPLAMLVVLSSLTSAFKVQLPIASGSNMSVSYVVDIAALIVWGPHATMVVGAASGWSQTTLNSQTPNPPYRTLFNIAILVLTVQAAGQVYLLAGGTETVQITGSYAIPLVAMALTYFVVNTVPIAYVIALTTRQSPWRIWRTEFWTSAPSYLVGALAAAVVIEVTQSSGYWLTLLLTALPLYLTYKVYRAGVETQARQGAILEAARDAIITMDQSLNIREFNPAAERIFGYGSLDVLGRNVQLLLPPTDRAIVMDALTAYQSSGGGPLAQRRLEVTAVKADGTEFPVELTAARVGTDSRAVMTAFISDITERRSLEEQLRQSQKLEAIGRLAGGVAHDFNNILMSIMGAADLLLMQLSREDPARMEATEIKQSVDRGAGVTRQLLAFSRRQATRPSRFALDETVGGMDTMLRRLIGPEIEFRIVPTDRPVGVTADAGQIEQVVMNLVINARDAMAEGGQLTVRVDELDIAGPSAISLVEGNDGRYARLAVADTGIGMDDRTKARLFEPFFTTKEQGKGTGLGLSIVYGIVKQSGGYVSVTSEPGRGTTFFIYLPSTPVAEPVPVHA